MPPEGWRGLSVRRDVSSIFSSFMRCFQVRKKEAARRGEPKALGYLPVMLAQGTHGFCGALRGKCSSPCCWVLAVVTTAGRGPTGWCLQLPFLSMAGWQFLPSPVLFGVKGSYVVPGA